MEINITSEFTECLELIEKGEKFVFITGAAGTGKSTLLRHIVRNSSKKMAILAPTGIAALNVGGQTIHSFCKLDTGVPNIRKIKKQEFLSNLLKKIELVIIDEISMVRADLFDAMNIAFQMNRDNTEFFGGVQLLVIGDLFQLPPIVNKKSNEADALVQLGYNPDRMFFFNSRIVQEFQPKILELKQVFRQNDKDFVDILSKIRNGKISKKEMEDLNKFCQSNTGIKQDIQSIILATRNDEVDKENSRQLDNISGKKFTYEAKITGNFNAKNSLSPEILELKIGAKVMFTKNGLDYRNGEIGVVHDISDSKINIKIGNNVIEIEKSKWENIEYKIEDGNFKRKVVGSFEQFPLKLGYAVTIHKSQGQTFDKVVINLGYGAFEKGQTYVAMSRCRSLNSIYLEKPITWRDVIVDEDVRDFCDKFVV